MYAEVQRMLSLIRAYFSHGRHGRELSPMELARFSHAELEELEQMIRHWLKTTPFEEGI